MAKRTKTSAARRAIIKRLNDKVESLTFELNRARKSLARTRMESLED